MEDPIRSCNPDRTILAELEMSMSICGYFEKHIPAQILALAHREAHLTKAATKIFGFFRFDSRRLAAIPLHIERITSKPGNSEVPGLRQLGHMVPKLQLISRDAPDRLGPQRYPFQLYQGREY
jgi:hypothetical protein